MKVSIVTPSYNMADTIEDTLKSVATQTYSTIEHLVIDGGSYDGTQEIVAKHNPDVFVSESDDGIFDAMNKGIAEASGDVIGILNADDFYANDDVIKTVVATLQESGADTCYGDLRYVNPEDTSKQVRFWRAGEYKPYKLKYGWIPPHPTFFVRSEVYEKYGNFDLEFPIAADYELMFRLLKVHDVSTNYVRETLTNMRAGGNSGESLSKRLAGWKELRRAWHKHDMDIPWYFSIMRPLHKVRQLNFISYLLR